MQNTIAIIFDFDDTLAPDATSSFLEFKGVDVPSFWQKDVKPLIDSDWDPVPAYLYMMLRYSNSGSISPITRQDFINWGKSIVFYNGVNRMFKRLLDYLKKINPGLHIEFYIVSSGIGEIIRNTKISGYFSGIYGCDFAYNDQDKITFPKKIVSFTDKTRYLFQISKGIVGKNFRGKPFEVNRKVETAKLRIPFDQMIFIGDGYTDIPCFSLIKRNNGYVFGVYNREQKERWGRAWGFIQESRVSNLLSADYGSNSDLSNNLMMAVRQIADRIVLMSRTYEA